MRKTCWGLLCLSLILLLAACGAPIPSQHLPTTAITSNSLDQRSFAAHSTPTPQLSISSQQEATPTPTPTPPATPTPTPMPTQQDTPTPTPVPSGNCVTYSNMTTHVPPQNGTLAAPYGPAPVTSEAQQLTQQLFQLINHDRAACGLPAFAWSSTLASGALLHSWNMIHCGFSHTCPDGSTPYQRIANEGFAGLNDCGENIGEAGPYPTPWAGVYNIQESMANEPLGGWHRIHLFSTTLHSVGIGVSVANDGSIWFTEDMVS